MSKINIYNKAKIICNRIEEKIHDKRYAVMFRDEILKENEDGFIPCFLYSDDEKSIFLKKSSDVFHEIIAADYFYDTFKNQNEMKNFFNSEFAFVKKSEFKKFICSRDSYEKHREVN